MSGLVLVDAASEFLKTSLTPAQWATYIKATKKLIEPNGLEAPDHTRTLDMLHGTPEVRAMPIVVVTSDKRFNFGAGGPETWPAWRSAQDRLAKVLNAKHVSDTNSGHAIQMEQPQLVINAIRQVVEAVRSESHHLARVQYYPCPGAAWALMANGDSGTGEAFIPVLKALQPIVEPLTVPSKQCAP